MKATSATVLRRRWLGLSLLAVGGSALVLKKGVERRAYLQEKEANARLAAATDARRQAEQAAKEKAAEGQRLFQASVTRVSAQARAILQQAAAADTQLDDACTLRLTQELDELRRQAFAQIPAIAEEMGSLAFIGQSVLLMAKDQLTGRSESEHWINSAMEPLNRTWLAMDTKVGAALEGLRQDLNRQSNEASQELLVAIEQVHQDLHQCDATLGKHLLDLLSPVLETIHAKQASLGIKSAVLAWEVVDFKDTYQPTKRLLTFLGKKLRPFVKRAVRAVAADAVLATLDGPLPIGDTIAFLFTLGLTGLTFYDLYVTSRRAPREIQSELNSTFQSRYKLLIEKSTEQSKRLRDQAQALRKTAFAPCLIAQR